MYNAFARNNTTHEDWKVIDKFDSTYWSGLDSQVYFDNILINEAIQLSYVVSEQIRPYFGYASYVANRIHHGARIIQGELSMNFKRDGYLFSLLRTIQSQERGSLETSNSSISVGEPEKQFPVKPFEGSFAAQIWDSLNNTGLPGNTAKEIVKKGKKLNEGDVNRVRPTIVKSESIFETRLDGFDIHITFGSNLSAARSLRWIGSDEYDLQGIDAQYGEGRVVQEPAGILASTGLKIKGVSIGGVAKTINDDGRPLIETYSFQAKDIEILHPIDHTNSRTSSTRSGMLQSPISKHTSASRTGQLGNDYMDPEEFPLRVGDGNYPI